MMKKGLTLLCILALCLAATGCKTIPPAPVETESAVSSSLGAQNPITGEYGFSPAALGGRPYAIMVSNIRAALPQYGVGSADLCYEVLAEGGITRIMAVFADRTKVPKIGPVRSVRDYYVDLAEGMQAILVHFGGSPKGYQAIRDYGTDDVDGMTCESSTFVQDAKRAAERGREHSFFTNAKLLNKRVKAYQYKTSRKAYSLFRFADESEPTATADGKVATHVEAPFSGYTVATFDYNAKRGLYLKGEFGEKQVDQNTGKQIAVKNVFVLYTDCTPIAGDRSGRIAVDLSHGKGLYLCEGKSIPIRWKKGAEDEMLRYYTDDGAELHVRAGKSWVCILPSGNKLKNKSK